jgi:hypothetical protein
MEGGGDKALIKLLNDVATVTAMIAYRYLVMTEKLE